MEKRGVGEKGTPFSLTVAVVQEVAKRRECNE